LPELAEKPLELARKATEVLAARGIESARLEAELLLAAALSVDRLSLYLQFERPVAPAELERFRGYVRRRLRGEPVQYIVGEVAFRQLVLCVDRRVLIPRPETEVLVGAVLRWTRERTTLLGRTLRGADIGTGSGAIALSLVAEGGCAGVVATDASSEALEVARCNAARCGWAHAVEFRHGAGWTPLGAETFDVVVSNPPYVAEAERAELAPEVVEWEPAGALFAGPDGFAVLDELITGAADRLVAGGMLALETGAAQAASVAARLGDTQRFEDVRVLADLAGRPRIVVAIRK
jgi:release factor glutamine methyltransferase